ncbi:uncharacterized protein GJ701_005722 [Geothlypis trichas]
MKQKIEGGELQNTELQEPVEMHNTERRNPFYDRKLDVKLRNLRPADRTVKGFKSASRTHCAHYLHTRVKDRSIHQALTLLRLNRQSLTSNRIHDQSQLCRNTGKVAVGKAPGNNRRLCTRVRQALPRAIRRPHAHRVFLPVKAAVPSGDRSSRDKESWRPPPAPCGRAARDGGSRATRCGNPAVRAAPGATPPPGARTHLPPGPGPAPPPTVMPRPLAEPRPPLPPPRSPAASGPSSDPQRQRL